MFAQVAKTAAARLKEVHQLLAHIESLEKAGVMDGSMLALANTLKGLFFVNLYGAFEYSVSQSVQVLLQEINKLGLPYEEFEHILYSVVLDPSFKSVGQVGSDKKWNRRKELLRLQISSDRCTLADTIFSDYLQNVWYETLDEVFECLCVASDPVPDRRLTGYIDEVVGKRNHVAHGDQSAQEVGRLKPAADLKVILDAISQTIMHIVGSLENHIQSRGFVSSAHRSKYLTHP